MPAPLLNLFAVILLLPLVPLTLSHFHTHSHSVTKQEIVDAVYQQTGRNLADSDIVMPEIKTLGTFECSVKLVRVCVVCCRGAAVGCGVMCCWVCCGELLGVLLFVDSCHYSL